MRTVGSGMDESLVGRRVISTTGGSGGYAELVAVEADGVIEVPDDLKMDAAVALLADGRTAGIRAKDRVLVEAAGGTGTLLVQMALDAGAGVIAAVGGARKVVQVRDLGADVVVDYREPDSTRRVRRSVGDLDVVFDGVGGEIGRSAFETLKRGGHMVRFGLSNGEWTSFSEEEAKERGVSLLATQRSTPEEEREFTEDARRGAASGRLRPVIGQRFPLERASEAHRHRSPPDYRQDPAGSTKILAQP